ncbi:MAG: hypothetical protein AAF828_11190, partial [Bacteroidota bacterium]
MDKKKNHTLAYRRIDLPLSRSVHLWTCVLIGCLLPACVGEPLIHTSPTSRYVLVLTDTTQTYTGWLHEYRNQSPPHLTVAVSGGENEQL